MGGRATGVNDPSVFQRRRKIFFVGLSALGVPFAGCVVVTLFRHVTWGPLAGVLLALATANLLWLWLGTRWVQAVQPAPAVPPDVGEAYMAAKRRFVSRRGIWRFGLLWGVSMAIWTSWNELPDHRTATVITTSFALRLGIGLVIWIPFGLLAGYMWGRVMWAALAPRVTVDRRPPPG